MSDEDKTNSKGVAESSDEPVIAEAEIPAPATQKTAETTKSNEPLEPEPTTAYETPDSDVAPAKTDQIPQLPVQESDNDNSVTRPKTKPPVADPALAAPADRPTPATPVSPEENTDDPANLPMAQPDNAEPAAAVAQTKEPEQTNESPDAQPQAAAQTQPQAPAKPEIVEKIIIKEAPQHLTEADKENIFKEKSQQHLTEANMRKRENYEQHLREIVAFIKSQGKLVSNQEIEDDLGVDDRTVINRLNELIKRGQVQRIGHGFQTKYKLSQGI